MPYNIGDSFSDFFGGLTNPDSVARRRLEEAKMPATLDDMGASNIYRDLERKAVAERYANPYSLDPTRQSRASLAAALENMARGANVSQAAGARSASRLQEQGGQALGGARSVGERVAVAQDLGLQGADMANQVGQGAMQEEQQKLSDYGQAIAQMGAGDRNVLGALTKGDIEQQSRMVEELNRARTALEVIESAQAGAKLDYEALLAKISDEARAGSVATLMKLAQVAGSIALMFAGPAGATAGAAGIANAVTGGRS